MPTESRSSMLLPPSAPARSGSRVQWIQVWNQFFPGFFLARPVYPISCSTQEGPTALTSPPSTPRACWAHPAERQILKIPGEKVPLEAGAGGEEGRRGWRLVGGCGDAATPSSLSTARTRWSPPSPGPRAPPRRMLGGPSLGGTSWPATCWGVSARVRDEVWPEEQGAHSVSSFGQRLWEACTLIRSPSWSLNLEWVIYALHPGLNSEEATV